MKLNEFKTLLNEIKGNKTQSDFATELGISRTYVNDLLQGKRNLSINTMTKIADRLGYDVEIKLVKKLTCRKQISQEK